MIKSQSATNSAFETARWNWPRISPADSPSSSHDDLTGCFRAFLFFRAAARIGAGERQQPSVLRFDDGYRSFQSVNDTFGHLTAVNFRGIGRLYYDELRSGDAAARFGGEECAAFLLDAELAQGLIAVNAFVPKLKTINSASSDAASRPKNIILQSAWHSSFRIFERPDWTRWNGWFRALSRQARGRNRVCSYSELTPEESGKVFLALKTKLLQILVLNIVKADGKFIRLKTLSFKY